jgi:hypothetical protein
MPEFGEEATRLANLAVEIMAERTGIRPDFSESSLGIVEDTLDEAARRLDRLTSSQVEGLIRQFGCYILEVGRREFGGVYQWYEHRHQPVLVVEGENYHVALMTWDKVRSRLEGDPADNIPFFYEGFASRVREKAPGTRVLVV